MTVLYFSNRLTERRSERQTFNYYELDNSNTEHKNRLAFKKLYVRNTKGDQTRFIYKTLFTNY